jgi:2-keto-3-deoxy-L-rhamnonate aldolase RhmA
MRDNPTKHTLASGGKAFGTFVFEFLSPGLPQILKNAGCEFVIYDMEHSGFTTSDLKSQLALCRGLDLVPLVRPPEKSYSSASKLLDLGAMGLLYPMVESAEEAADLVCWTRYPPGGVRGGMFGGAHDDYGAEAIPDVMAQAHARTMVCVLIETAKGLANIDEIMAVPGVDVAFLGHVDLSLSLGIPGQFDHPDMEAAIDQVAAAAARHGKTAGTAVGRAKQGHEFMARGFRMLCYFFDMGILQRGLTRGIEGLKKSGG